MKHIFNLLNLFACILCLLGECKLDTEVLGTYDMIDGFRQQHSFQTQQPVNNEKEDQSKQVSAPLIDTTTASPSKPYQTATNRLPTVSYNPIMARKIGLSTLMMSGVLYGLTMLPALIAISGATPLAGK